MPLFEMPLADLDTYMGRNPRPLDFDAFWARALAELRQTPPDVELRPAGFRGPAGISCFDLYFQGVGGARVHAKYLRPEAKGPHPAVLFFHGYSLDSGDWVGRLPYAAAGFSVAALDVRGQGGESQDPGGVVGNTLHGHIIRGLDDEPDRLLYRNVYLDCVRLAQIVMDMPEVDGDRVGASGYSQGGGLTLACAALEPRIRRAAPVYPFLCDFQRVWEMDLALDAYLELKEYFRRFDPLHERQEQVFERLGYLDNQHLADRIKGDVFFITALMDTICPPSTQFAAYNRITSTKRMLRYPDFGHESLPGADDRIYEFLAGL